MFNRIVNIFSVPIMFLNMGGGIVGGIWLAILGEWRLLGIGIFLLVTSPWILSLLMFPNLLIAGFSMHLYEKKHPFRHLIGYIAQLYTNILIVVTCGFAFFICSRFYSGNSSFGYIPYLLWSWGMALGPWQFFASKEPNNEFSAITLFSASVFYFLFLASLFISPVLAFIIIIIFGVVQLIVLPIFNMYLASQMQENGTIEQLYKRYNPKMTNEMSPAGLIEEPQAINKSPQVVGRCPQCPGDVVLKTIGTLQYLKCTRCTQVFPNRNS